MTPTVTNRRPSAIDALGEALAHMRAHLFPFRFGGWILLGFVALLENCGSGAGEAAARNRVGGARPMGGDPTEWLETSFAWIAAHMVIFVTILMVAMVLSLVFMWLRSRAIFVYVDDVASGRFDLVRPWNEHASHADSYFVLSLIVQGASFILLLLIVALGGFFVLWARAHEWAGMAIVFVAIPIGLAFLFGLLVAGIANMILRDFIAPLQIIRNVSAREAGSVFFNLLGTNLGLMIGYAILKFLAGIVVGIVVAMGICLTCCIGAVPLVHQTLFQPIYYAERAWSLKLLAQLGEDVFGALTPPIPPAAPAPQESEPPVAPLNLSEIAKDLSQS